MLRTRFGTGPLVGFVSGLCILLLASPCLAVEQARPGRIIDEILEASVGGGIEDHAAIRDALVREIETIAARFGPGRPTYRRARRMHELIHERDLKHYDANVDGLHRLLDDGSFNCLSATLFEGLVAEALGYEASIVQYPGHVLLRLRFGQRVVDVESTSPAGFDVRLRRGFIPILPNGTPGLVTTPWSDGNPEPFGLSIEEAIGFVWLNRAHRELDRGEAMAAAGSVVEAGRFLPDLTERVEGIRLILAHAFRHEYDAARFDNAFAIASIEMDLIPESVSSRDRVLAATVKRIQAASESDDPRLALDLLDATGALVPVSDDVARLERRATPSIVVAAVRIGDWDLARSVAARYAAAEPDPIEYARLVAWVDLRQSCVDDPVCAATDYSPTPDIMGDQGTSLY